MTTYRRKSLVLMICLLGLTACQGKKQGSLKIIGISELTDKFIQQETFFVCISRTGCDYCAENETNLKAYVRQHDITVFMVYSDEDPDTFEAFRQQWMPELNRVPTTYYVQNGVIKDSISGEMDDAVWDTWLVRLRDKAEPEDKEGR